MSEIGAPAIPCLCFQLDSTKRQIGELKQKLEKLQCQFEETHLSIMAVEYEIKGLEKDIPGWELAIRILSAFENYQRKAEGE